MRYSSHFILVRMAIMKKQKVTNIGKDIEKREPLYTIDGNVN
jgi:hypothetical protein